MDWSADAWRSAFRIELRVQAIEFATRGWPVLPGTYLEDSRLEDSQWVGGSGAEDASGPVPVHSDWRDRSWGTDDETTLEDAISWWTRQPYSLLVATGDVVGALEVSAPLGHRAARALREHGAPAPIVATPQGRWYFLTAGAQELDQELADSGEITSHGAGSWVPMPPTTYDHGVVHWRVKPEVCGWRLPEPQLVRDALREGVRPRPDVADLAGVVR